MIGLVEATFTIIPLIGKFDSDLVVPVLESVGEFLCNLMFRFGKFKERKTELATSNLFNLIVDHYLHSSKPALF